VFDSVVVVKPALTILHTACDTVAAADVALVGVDELGPSILSLQKAMDRLRVVQSRLLLEADRHRIWAASGHRDIAAWLAANGRTSRAAAKRQRDLGEALTASPELSDAVDAGLVGPEAAAALLPTLNSAHSGDAADLVEACRGATPEQARDAGTMFQEVNKPVGESDAEREHRRRSKRRLSFTDLGDGTTRVDGVLTASDAAIVRTALQHLCAKPSDNDDRSREQKMADALVALADAYSRGAVTGGRERATVVVMIDIDVLEGRMPGAGRAADGTIIPAEIVRRMCTNANLQRLLISDSMPLDLGRTRRLASDAQFTALVARDGGCRMDDCPIPPEWCEVDHILEWDAQTGPTDLNLLVLWCLYHHHIRHQPGVTLHGTADNLSMTFPDGTTIHLPPRGPTTQTNKRRDAA
jgi:hypothetical protein